MVPGNVADRYAAVNDLVLQSAQKVQCVKIIRFEYKEALIARVCIL